MSKRNSFKKLLSLFILLILFSFSITVQGKETISLKVPEIEVKNNRLFNIGIYVKTNINLAAATFEITYDNNFIEYRKSSISLSDGMVKTVDESSKTKAIFLYEKGIKSDRYVKLFDVVYKSIQSGNCEYKIKMYDCVDINGNTVDSDAVYKSDIFIMGNVSLNSNSSVHSDKKKSDADNPSDDFEYYDEGEDGYKGNGKFSVLSNSKENQEVIFICLFFIAVFLVLLAFIIFLFLNRKKLKGSVKRNKSVKDKNSEYVEEYLKVSPKQTKEYYLDIEDEEILEYLNEKSEQRMLEATFENPFDNI